MTVDSLYRRLLGDDFDLLPPIVRALHSPDPSITFIGQATVEPAATRLGARIARVMRLPPPGQHTLRLTVERGDGAETWTRLYGTQRFASTLRLNKAYPSLLEERLGFLTLVSVNTGDADGATMVGVSARIGPLPLPRFLTPRANALEDVDVEGRLRFDVQASLPGLGLIVRYRGYLALENQTPR